MAVYGSRGHMLPKKAIQVLNLKINGDVIMDNHNLKQIVENAANCVCCYQKHKEVNDAEKEVCK